MKFGIRPKQGEVLVQMLPVDHQTESGLFLDENRRLHDAIGRQPAQRAKVVACGMWPTSRSGRMYAYDFKVGDLVMVDPVLGKNLQAHPVRLKLYGHREILAKVQ